MGYRIDIDGNKLIAPSYDYDKTLYHREKDDDYKYFLEDDAYAAGKPFGNHLRNNFAFIKANGMGISLHDGIVYDDIAKIVYSVPGSWSDRRKENISRMIERRYLYVKACKL